MIAIYILELFIIVHKVYSHYPMRNQ
jgi:hypothetical protein